jgi:tetratricopeptide (TPR) repeat protein
MAWPWLVGVLTFVLLLLPAPAAAHGDLHEQIAAMTRRIEQAPARADLYVRRGQLHRAHGEWDAALADYDQAARLDPELAVVDFLRGVALLDAGRPAAARAALDRFLARRPDHAEAHATRARAQVGLGHRLAASQDFSLAIALVPQPRPEYYIERAQALAAAGDAHLDDALRGLDDGIDKLGPLVTLQLYAVDLELARERPAAALARLDRMLQRVGINPTWLVRRAEILERAGRPGEARAAYASSLAALDRLAPSRRASKAMDDLTAKVRTALERLEAAR